MRQVAHRRFLCSYFILIIVWSILIFLIHIIVGNWYPLWFGATWKLDREQLKLLMNDSFPYEHNSSWFVHPLLQLLAPGGNFLHYFHLPKRKSHLNYGEVCSPLRYARKS